MSARPRTAGCLPAFLDDDLLLPLSGPSQRPKCWSGGMLWLVTRAWCNFGDFFTLFCPLHFLVCPYSIHTLHAISRVMAETIYVCK